MPFPAPIVAATGNPHKVEEIAKIFAEIDTPVISLSEAANGRDLIEPEETGETFEDNAAIKALGYADQLGRICLADDSGLVVDALGGAPGVRSARYSARPGHDPLPRAERDRANNHKLLGELADVPPEQRSARFICCMALATPVEPGSTGEEGPKASSTRSRILAVAEGVFEGRIGRPGEVPRGHNGFGYDPLFLIAPEFVLTSAQLDPEKKNMISHRGAAARLMAQRIAELVPAPTFE